ncbi:MAG TPA: general stress protein [Polyangiaceae bacterium]|nr:general stress protein [Polyangiaceae bacterium]
MKKSVIGIVETQMQAERIVDQLQGSGVASSNISVLFPDKRGTKDFAHEHNTKAPEGAVAGVGAGGVIGGTLGLLAGIGALAIPGVGPLIAAGPLMATLSGAAAGATVGGITGGLIGLGMPEYEAKSYEGKVRGGNILVAVHTDNSDTEKRAKQVFEANGAHDVSVTGDASVPKDEKKEQISRF